MICFTDLNSVEFASFNPCDKMDKGALVTITPNLVQHLAQCEDGYFWELTRMKVKLQKGDF